MNTSLIENQVVNFLSKITGQKITQRDVTPLVIFVANLIIVLLGVMFADGIVTDKEKQKLVEILARFSTPESDIRRFKYLMIKGVKKYQLYIKFNELVIITKLLSESEQLLLVGLGYEMSTIDGKLGWREQRYLEMLAQFLGVKPQHFAVLASAFKPQEKFDIEVFNEVDDLLNALRPQELNTEAIKQHSNELKALPANSKAKTTQPRVSIYYEGLKKFQEFSKQLGNYCHHIFQIVQACHELGFLSKDLIDEVSELSRKLELHRFRLAIIGEFSQGKSTLINTLLGEEIQPMQEIPCNGTVVVLKYGVQKRIICRYKNGSEEEISFDDYRQKVSISQDTVIGSISEEVAQSAIEEIVIEHPNLALCNSGVEIIDSPGLNENPELTAITQKLLQNIDAAIFVTNASRALTQSERELLNKLRIKLNGGKDEEPANNLFIVCNFIDLISTEKSREQIKKRIYTIVEGDKPIITGKNRVHFISAQSALNAVLNGYDDEYKKSFDIFVKSIERFLIIERGRLKLQPLSEQLNKLIQKIIKILNEFKDDLETKIKIAEHEKRKILEQIGGFSGRDVKITLLTIQLIEQGLEQANISWNKWNKGLEERMILRSEQWSSEHKLFWKQDKLIRDYIQCFVRDLSNEIDEWVNNQLKNVILQESLLKLDRDINYELDAIQSDFNLLDMRNNTIFSEELKRSINDITEQLIELDNIDFSAALKGELLVFTGIGFIPVTLANITGVIASSFGSMMLDGDGLHEEIKMSVLETGLQKFDESLDKIYEKLEENIEKFFDIKVESVSRVIEEAIYTYEKVLEQQEKSHQEMLEKHYANKSWILDKCEELEQINNRISKDITLWYSEEINKVIINPRPS
ncbi:MAG: dynamin family protein [Nodularia sp. CChRGM 3473]